MLLLHLFRAVISENNSKHSSFSYILDWYSSEFAKAYPHWVAHPATSQISFSVPLIMPLFTDSFPLMMETKEV